MHAFDYEAPLKLAEALDLLARHSGKARPLAGGTDLIDQMRVGRHQPELVVDVKKIAELNVLAADGAGLRIGAAVPCYRIAAHPVVQANYTALADSCQIIGGIQIQSRATIGGNLCNSGPAADSAPSLLALGARCLLAGPQGEREVAAAEFCTGPGRNILQPGELLVEFRLPVRPPQSGSHYRRMIPRNEMDIAVVGVGASVTLAQGGQQIAEATVSLGAVAPTPLLAKSVNEFLRGAPCTPETWERAAALARELAAPITDMRGTREYRVHVVGVLVQRVLQAAVARAQGQTVEVRPGH